MHANAYYSKIMLIKNSMTKVDLYILNYAHPSVRSLWDPSCPTSFGKGHRKKSLRYGQWQFWKFIGFFHHFLITLYISLRGKIFRLSRICGYFIVDIESEYYCKRVGHKGFQCPHIQGEHRPQMTLRHTLSNRQIFIGFCVEVLVYPGLIQFFTYLTSSVMLGWLGAKSPSNCPNIRIAVL